MIPAPQSIGHVSLRFGIPMPLAVLPLGQQVERESLREQCLRGEAAAGETSVAVDHSAARRRTLFWLALAAIALALCASTAGAADQSPVSLNLTVGGTGDGDSKEFSGVVQILILMTLLSVIPALLLTTTSFTRIIIVLSFVRRAMSLQQSPPNQVIIGLALFLTVFVMGPVWQRANEEALKPYLEETISQKEALAVTTKLMRTFMIKHTRKKDLALFVHIAELKELKGIDEVPTHVLIPAFVTSELRTAFQMGFAIFIPFLIIDMVVATVLTSMGMFMLPPIIVSVPFKILLFVLVDGWHLVVRSLALSFAG